MGTRRRTFTRVTPSDAFGRILARFGERTGSREWVGEISGRERGPFGRPAPSLAPSAAFRFKGPSLAARSAPKGTQCPQPPNTQRGNRVRPRFPRAKSVRLSPQKSSGYPSWTVEFEEPGMLNPVPSSQFTIAVPAVQPPLV